MSSNLKIHFKAFYLIGKLFCLNPFMLAKNGAPKYSIIGNGHCLLFALGYGYFHLYVSINNMQAKETKADTNLVRTIIDVYNQFAGCTILLSIILISVLRQSNLMQSILIFYETDQLIEDKFKLKINNIKWMR